jgi:hypothetical protein
MSDMRYSKGVLSARTKTYVGGRKHHSNTQKKRKIEQQVKTALS